MKPDEIADELEDIMLSGKALLRSSPGNIPYLLQQASCFVSDEQGMPGEPVPMTRDDLMSRLSRVHDAISTLPKFNAQQRALKCVSRAIRAIERPDVTINIPVDAAHPLPVAVYTLHPATIAAILSRVGGKKDAWYTCKKFAATLLSMERDGDRTEADGAQFLTHNGHLYVEGCNMVGQAGVNSRSPWIRHRTHVPLPPVRELFHGWGSVFALTTRGLYAWGNNRRGRLGGDCVYRVVTKPIWVHLPDPAALRRVVCLSSITLYNTGLGDWLGSGVGSGGRLGLPTHQADPTVPVPTPIPGSAGIMHWMGGFGSTFGWSAAGDALWACGDNSEGQLGLPGNHADPFVYSLTPIPLPSTAGAIRKVVTHSQSTFVMTTRGTFAAGSNSWGELGITPPGPTDPPLPPLAAVPFPVDAVITNSGTTVMVSGNDLLLAGTNAHTGLPAASFTKSVCTITLPFPVDELVLSRRATFMRCATDGTWHAVGAGDRGALGVGEVHPVPHDDSDSDTDYDTDSDTDNSDMDHSDDSGTGLMGGDSMVRVARPVAVPPGLDIRRVWSRDDVTYFLTDKGVFATGVNFNGRLAVDRHDTRRGAHATAVVVHTPQRVQARTLWKDAQQTFIGCINTPTLMLDD